MSMQQQVLKDKELQKVFWQSDQPIVSMKQGNACREKGLARMRWDIRATTASHRPGVQLTTKLMSLTLRAKGNPNYKFRSLAYLLNEDFLTGCFNELKRDKAPGIDRVTVKEYEVNKEGNIRDLVVKMKAWEYKPKPSRRVYIPKSNGAKRGLGIPSVEDKIVQLGMKKILETIFEPEFLDVSYGFRPNRSCHTALNKLDKTIMSKPVNYVVDMDIKGFFDNIDHKWLKECLKQRIADPNFLRLIARFLKAGIMEQGKYIKADKGTPQGGILSPLLANIYLHYVLDLWFEKVVKKQLKGYGELIRYADDFIVCFQLGSEAKEFANLLKQRLAKFNLKIAKDKSRIIEFGRYAWQRAQPEGKKVSTFDFLGFTHYCDRTRKGNFKLGRKTARAIFSEKAKAINLWLKKIRNLVQLREWWQILRAKLLGHYHYYGISGNFLMIRKFYILLSKLAYKWINRRSQRKSYTYKQYCRFKEYNPLPRPKIYHLTYTLSSL